MKIIKQLLKKHKDGIIIVCNILLAIAAFAALFINQNQYHSSVRDSNKPCLKIVDIVQITSFPKERVCNLTLEDKTYSPDYKNDEKNYKVTLKNVGNGVINNLKIYDINFMLLAKEKIGKYSDVDIDNFFDNNTQSFVNGFDEKKQIENRSSKYLSKDEEITIYIKCLMKAGEELYYTKALLMYQDLYNNNYSNVFTLDGYNTHNVDDGFSFNFMEQSKYDDTSFINLDNEAKDVIKYIKDKYKAKFK